MKYGYDNQQKKYPHGRGETEPGITIVPFELETPPRAWGNPLRKTRS